MFFALFIQSAFGHTVLSFTSLRMSLVFSGFDLQAIDDPIAFNLDIARQRSDATDTFGGMVLMDSCGGMKPQRISLAHVASAHPNA